MTFGSFIKERREALGYTIRGLAAMLGMTHTYLNDIEHATSLHRSISMMPSSQSSTSVAII